MKLTFIATAVLLLPLMAAAQTRVPAAPRTDAPAAPAITAPGFSLPPGLNAGLFEQFWNDPAIVAELHLTDTQRKQLQDAALAQQLSLIDGGAEALKALARLSALLQADQLDDLAYKQQVNILAQASGKLIQDVGEMVASPRRVLTVEQWRKLQALQRAKRSAPRTAVPTRQPPAHPPAAGDGSRSIPVQ